MDRTATSSQLECKCPWVVFEYYGPSMSFTFVRAYHAINKHPLEWQMVAEGFILFAVQTCSPWLVSSVYAGPFFCTLGPIKAHISGWLHVDWIGTVLLHFINLQ
jgi:hypothetical protein